MFRFRMNVAAAVPRRTQMSIAHVPAQKRAAPEPMHSMRNGIGGALSTSMIGRIYSAKPGCSSCGKRVA